MIDRAALLGIVRPPRRTEPEPAPPEPPLTDPRAVELASLRADLQAMRADAKAHTARTRAALAQILEQSRTG